MDWDDDPKFNRTFCYPCAQKRRSRYLCSEKDLITWYEAVP